VFPAGDAAALSAVLAEALHERGEDRAARRAAVLARIRSADEPTVPELLEEITGSPRRLTPPEEKT
jgi:hypothetical protein